MTHYPPDTIKDAFRTQIGFCRHAGSPLTARVLAAVLAALSDDSRTGARIRDWPGDPMVDALKLRIAGGLNALARSGQDAELSALYNKGEGDFAGVIARVLRDWDDWLYPWLDSAPQTNETGRSGLLWPGVMEIARRFGPQVELLELGASAGLNLNMDRFGYRLGGVAVGDGESVVQLAPTWEGVDPVTADVAIVSRTGVDLNPLDASEPAVAARLMAYIWPDEAERVARAEAAIAIAQAFPPKVEAGDGADWIERKLQEPQAGGVTRIVYHSIALQYFPPEGRERVQAAIEAAGARATAERPLAWLSMEAPEVVTESVLTLRCWPRDGAVQHLATCHPHGSWICWGS